MMLIDWHNENNTEVIESECWQSIVLMFFKHDFRSADSENGINIIDEQMTTYLKIILEVMVKEGEIKNYIPKYIDELSNEDFFKHPAIIYYYIARKWDWRDGFKNMHAQTTASKYDKGIVAKEPLIEFQAEGYDTCKVQGFISDSDLNLNLLGTRVNLIKYIVRMSCPGLPTEDASKIERDILNLWKALSDDQSLYSNFKQLIGDYMNDNHSASVEIIWCQPGTNEEG